MKVQWKLFFISLQLVIWIIQYPKYLNNYTVTFMFISMHVMSAVNNTYTFYAYQK